MIRKSSATTTFLVLLLALVAIAAIPLVVHAQEGFPSTARAGYAARTHAAIAAYTNLPCTPTGVLVRFRSQATAAERGQARAVAAGNSVTQFRLVPGLELIETPTGVERALGLLREHPAVEYAEPDYILRAQETIPNDAYFSKQWAPKNTGATINKDRGTAGADIRATFAWDNFTGDPDFVVAAIDTGVDYTHPDLAANIWTNPGEIPGDGIDNDGNGYIDDIHGWDFYNNLPDPMDTYGHGTKVAGIIGAVGNNGAGIAGLNWRCKIMALQTMPNGLLPVSVAVEALQYAVDNGAKVSNNSYGWQQGVFTPWPPQALGDAISSARDRSHLFVAAAGNSGALMNGYPYFGVYPACFDSDNIISVAATDNDDQLASWSNYGPVTVDLGAPGVNTYTTALGGGYALFDGTSAASPHVAGVAALLWGANPGADYTDVKGWIMSSTRPLASLAGKTVTGGILNAAAALQASGVVPSAPSGLAVSKVSAGVARLTWTDNSGNETGFQIAREKYVSKKWVTSATWTVAPDTIVTQDNAGAGTFHYRVRAVNGSVNSAWTNWSPSITL